MQSFTAIDPMKGFGDESSICLMCIGWKFIGPTIDVQWAMRSVYKCAKRIHTARYLQIPLEKWC